MKLGIIVDSSCGLIKKEADKLGWGYLPLYMTINGKEYADGVDISPSEYYKMIDINMDVKTSATPPGIINDVLQKASKEFDHVIVYPLSKELSSQTNNILIASKEFSNVHVIPSTGVGYGIVSHCKQLIELSKNEDSIENIMSKGIELTNSLWGLAIPETLTWLVKGGRASSGAAGLANMLKIVPVIQFKEGKLEKYGKGRVFNKTVIKSAKDMVGKLKHEDIEWVFLSAGNKDEKYLSKEVERIIGRKIKVVSFPPIIGNHIGKGAIAILSIKK